MDQFVGIPRETFRGLEKNIDKEEEETIRQGICESRVTYSNCSRIFNGETRFVVYYFG